MVFSLESVESFSLLWPQFPCHQNWYLCRDHPRELRKSWAERTLTAYIGFRQSTSILNLLRIHVSWCLNKGLCYCKRGLSTSSPLLQIPAWHLRTSVLNAPRDRLGGSRETYFHRLSIVFNTSAVSRLLQCFFFFVLFHVNTFFISLIVSPELNPWILLTSD